MRVRAEWALIYWLTRWGSTLKSIELARLVNEASGFELRKTWAC